MRVHRGGRLNMVVLKEAKVDRFRQSLLPFVCGYGQQETLERKLGLSRSDRELSIAPFNSTPIVCHFPRDGLT